MRRRPEERVHFRGLDGLRFFAALAVVIGHVELLKKYCGYENDADQPVLYELGRIAVTFFFVLSGFLITYLLLAEKERTGRVAVGKFYVRRILRIWPLYYLVVFLAFAVLPRIAAFRIGAVTTSALPLFLLLLPQIALSLHPPVPFAEPLWSIGVEEQFYLLWPLLVGRVRRFLPLALFIAVSFILAKTALLAYASTVRDEAQLPFWNHLIDYFYFTRLECMAIGAIGAWLVMEKKEAALRLLFRRDVQLAAYALAAYLVLTSRGKPLLHYALHSVIFCILIMNIAVNPRSLVKMESRWLTFLGNISYGMYMLHEIAIVAVLRTLPTRSNIILYAASAAATIAAASVVYYGYEAWFLRLKTRFAVIRSGPEAPRELPAPAATASA
ncbi:MAG TPA: acyltransferase [Thermoanaerobaculia bacterium]|nr:acyltransferase [Thermoanaerobaculia bacterium]